MSHIATAVLSLRETFGPSHPRDVRPRRTGLFGFSGGRRRPDHPLSDRLLSDIGLSRADLAALVCDARHG